MMIPLPLQQDKTANVFSAAVLGLILGALARKVPSLQNPALHDAALGAAVVSLLKPDAPEEQEPKTILPPPGWNLV